MYCIGTVYFKDTQLHDSFVSTKYFLAFQPAFNLYIISVCALATPYFTRR